MERVWLGKILFLALALPVVLVVALREPPGGTPMVLPVLPHVAAKEKLAPPKVTTTCMTADTELVAYGESPILCWANGVCAFGDDVVPRPAAMPETTTSA